MNKRIRGSYLFWQTLMIFLILCAFPLVTALDYQEGIHLIRPESQYIDDTYPIPEYLTVEDITFISCLEEDFPLYNSLLCLDDNSFEDLETEQWSDQSNCYISSYNLENFQCERLQLQAEYTVGDETFKMTEMVRVNKLTKVLDKLVDSQYSDGGWQDPLSTAYAIWALSYFNEIYEYELDLALDWLKLERNEDKKCWPKSPCNVEMSSNVLSLLTLSNYTDARRVVNDARNWFEELQNTYDQGDTWTVGITAVNENTTLTLVSYDMELLDENFTIPLEEEKNYTFTAKTDSRLLVISDDNVIAKIYNQDDDVLITYQGDNLSYYMPGPCWSLNLKGEPCDATTSLFALSADIDEDQKSLAKEWATDSLEEGKILGYYLGDEDSVIDTALYLYSLYAGHEDSDYIHSVIDWILYTQNNEGSWDDGTTGEKASPSAYAVLSLVEADFNRSSEPVQDAEEWASDNEDNISENNTIALASAFYILHHTARPVLSAQPTVIIMDSPTMQVDLFNPTTFNLAELTYELSPELEDELTIDQREEIDAYTYRKITLTRQDTTTKEAYGFLIVKNLDDPVATIPIILTDTPNINITLPQAMTIFGKNGEVKGSVQKTSHDFVCSVDWNSDEISSPGSFRVTSTLAQIPFQFTQALTKEDSYSGTVYCTAAGKSISQPISLYISRYSSQPLSISPLDMVVNSTSFNPTFTLTNNLDRDLTVQISLDRYSNYFSFPSAVQLNPNEEFNLTLTNRLPSDLNLTSSVLVDFTVLELTDSVSMLIDVTAATPSTSVGFGSLIPLLIVLLLLSVLAYFVWKFRDVLIAELNKLNYWKVKTEKQKESKKIKTLKRTEQQQAIINIFNIMKFQNKDDKEIAQRLLGSFSREEIKKALDVAGSSLPFLDEEEPELLSKKK